MQMNFVSGYWNLLSTTVQQLCWHQHPASIVLKDWVRTKFALLTCSIQMIYIMRWIALRKRWKYIRGGIDEFHKVLKVNTNFRHNCTKFQYEFKVIYSKHMQVLIGLLLKE